MWPSNTKPHLFNSLTYPLPNRGETLNIAMITLFFESTQLNRSNFKTYQAYYDELIEKLFNNRSELPSKCCPGETLKKHSKYLRHVRTHQSTAIEKVYITRIICSGCGRTHALFPFDIVPYCQCGLKTAFSFIVNFEEGKTYKDALEGSGGVVDENDYYRAVKKYRSNWKQRIETINQKIKDFSENFQEACKRCIDTFKRQFLQIRDRFDYSFVLIT